MIFYSFGHWSYTLTILGFSLYPVSIGWHTTFHSMSIQKSGTIYHLLSTADFSLTFSSRLAENYKHSHDTCYVVLVFKRNLFYQSLLLLLVLCGKYLRRLEKQVYNSSTNLDRDVVEINIMVIYLITAKDMTTVIPVLQYLTTIHNILHYI
jgi:hypothetical protein